MDIRTSDVQFFIEDHSEGKCSVGIRPINGHSASLTAQYIPEDQRSTMLNECTAQMDHVFNVWSSTYENTRADLFNSLHSAPSRELVGQDIDDYLDKQMLTKLFDLLIDVVEFVLECNGYETVQ